MNDQEIRDFITGKVLARLSGKGERRTVALRDVLGFAAPGIDAKDLTGVAELVPELPRSLYERWAGLFADRLLETVRRDQLEDLCLGTEESDASLLLVYAMFMESERMEKTVAEDLAAFAAGESPDSEKAAVIAAWLRQHVPLVGEKQ